MTTTAEAVLDDALQLPPVDRASMIEELLSGFDAFTRQKIDNAWAVEIESRIEAYGQGAFSSRPAEDVFRDINHSVKCNDRLL